MDVSTGVREAFLLLLVRLVIAGLLKLQKLPISFTVHGDPPLFPTQLLKVCNAVLFNV
jgi:hypothetical protein